MMRSRACHVVGKAILFFVIMTMFPACNLQTGLIVYKEGAQDGYTLVNCTGGYAYVIDMMGEVVHVYNSFIGRMLPGGTLLGRDMVIPGGMIESVALREETWDGTITWSFSEWEFMPVWGWMCRVHHDFQREGNPVGYYAPGQDFVEQGRTLCLAHRDIYIPEIADTDLLDDIIYEVDWAGNQTFLWNAADHIDEFGFDEDALAHIYLFAGDWLHVNAISRLGENHWYDDDPGDTRFHPENIILDSHHAGFIVIIDHQTGEVLWRVGPDYSEGFPEADLGPLIGMHNVHMIPKGLPGEGNILVFDNGSKSGWGGKGLFSYKFKYSRSYSRIVEFDPMTLEIVWEHSPRLGHDISYSALMSSAQRLPNGNTLINSANPGRLIEVTPEHEIVWEWIEPTHPAVYTAIRVPPEWMPVSHGYEPWE